MSDTPIVNIQEKAGGGHDSSILAAMLANGNRNGMDGMGSWWPLLLLAGRGGGFFGGGDRAGAEATVAADLGLANVAANLVGVKDAVAATNNGTTAILSAICGTDKEIACVAARIQEGISKIENLQLMTTMKTENLIQRESCEIKGEIAAKFGAVMARLDCIESKRQEETICALRARLAEIEQTDAIKKALLCGPCGSGVFPTPAAAGVRA